MKYPDSQHVIARVSNWGNFVAFAATIFALKNTRLSLDHPIVNCVYAIHIVFLRRGNYFPAIESS